MRPLVEIKGISKSFKISRGLFARKEVADVIAVDDVSFDIHQGETLGCVGGSGCGKSTLGRMILRLLEPDTGEVWFNGELLTAMSNKQFRPFRHEMQIVFQDPLLSLNPRRTVAENISRPLLNFGCERHAARTRSEELLELVGLDPTHAERYPHEFSGGQCQRIAIARAIALNPRFLFLDEPVSSLDVSVQAQILNLLLELQEKLGITYLFVSHDLKLVKHFADRIMVMYRGQIVEIGKSEDVYRTPKHPFTENFLKTVLHISADADWHTAALRAEDLEDPNLARVTTSADKHPGCIYTSACTERFERCRNVAPKLRALDEHHYVACHLYDSKIRPKRAFAER